MFPFFPSKHNLNPKSNLYEQRYLLELPKKEGNEKKLQTYKKWISSEHYPVASPSRTRYSYVISPETRGKLVILRAILKLEGKVLSTRIPWKSLEALMEATSNLKLTVLMSSLIETGKPWRANPSGKH